MNFENVSKIIFEGYRAIGLKEDDMNRLSAANKKSVFTEANPVEVKSEVQNDSYNMPNNGPVVVSANQPVVPEVSSIGNESNIFDGSMSQIDNNSQVFGVASPQPVPGQNLEQNVVSTVNVFDSPSMNEDVQGGQTMSETAQLDTPQTFFAREEQEPVVQSNAVSEISQDPVIIMLDEITAAYNRQKATNNELSQKVVMLEERLRQSEEARKVAEAQRDAAQQTLAVARQAETTGGPTLVYQPNYNKAA